MAFDEFRHWMESHGWTFQGIYRKRFRLFIKRGDEPIVVPVDDKEVSDEYVKRIKTYVEGRRPRGKGA